MPTLRIFVSVGIASIAMLVAGADSPVFADAQFPDRLKLNSAPVVKPAVELFDLSQVQITSGPFKEAMETDQAYLLRLDPDRLLAWFRKDAGLASKGEVYGGWESQGVAGHSLGHYLSACSHMYRATGDERLKQRVNYIVEQLAECQQANGNGYVAAIPNGKKIFAEVAGGDIRPQGGFNLNGGWVPWYTMHKVMAGLLDSADLCGNTKALGVLLKLTDWCEKEVEHLDDAQMQKMLSVEQGGMAEVLANLYAVTGDPKHLALARRFRHDQIFIPISQGKDILTGWHGNANIPKFIGYQRIYELTGDADWGTAAKNFWTFVSQDRSFVTGGHGLYEHFLPIDQLERAMHSTNGPETCNTYNMLKLTTHLYENDPQSDYIDFYERALYNHILASQHPGKGGLVYYTPMSPGSFRTYSSDFDDFWCCVGTGMENHATYGRLIYAHQGDTLLVNLFIPSQLSWSDQGVTLTQETTFPDESRTALHFKLNAPKTFTVAVRCPKWVADDALNIRVNGTAIPVAGHPGQYAKVKREWHDGDVLQLDLPMQIHTEMLPHSESYVAIMDGPIVLAGELGNDGLLPSDFQGQMMAEKKAEPANKIPAIIDAVGEISTHIEPVPGQPLVFKTHDLLKPGDVNLAPLYEVYDQRCAIYWRMTTADKWEADEAKWAAAEQHEHDLAARTIDHVRPGEQQPEVDHQFAGEKTNNGTFETRNWRDAHDGGWFSYSMKVDPSVDNQLLCTYWGSDVGGRQFDILIDGKLLATQIIDNNKPDEFFEVTYPIPADLIRGKTRVEVKFQAKPGMMAGGLFDCRVLK
jgi:uncharacterized protein